MRLGVSTRTLQRWDADGSLRVVRTPHGKRRIPLAEVERLQGLETGNSPHHPRVVCIYARVSSHDQKVKGDLDRQVAHLRQHLPGGEVAYPGDSGASESPGGSGSSQVLVITDVASGLSDKRKGLSRLMDLAARREVTDVVITYKDRLTRFGFGYLERYFSSHGVKIHLVDSIEDRKSLQEELVEDLLSIVTSFSGKLYGLRSHHKAKELVKSVREAMTGANTLTNGGDDECSPS